MPFPASKTKIVCTLGPASSSAEIMESMVNAGMNVARLNFSHGDFAGHQAAIETLRAASRRAGRRVAVMADLPGPKIRIGELAQEPIELRRDDDFILTTDKILGSRERAFVDFALLPKVVKPGDELFINDGIIRLRVEEIAGADVRCRVLAGGELRSRKGLNLPGIDLGSCAFTARDRECLDFALSCGVEAISQSFVDRASDIEALREAAAQRGERPFVIAKIERAGALERIDEILAAADGIMVARGDLGVEIPIERIALVQKDLMRKARRAGKPVITATQMLESMTVHSRPTRAEATDVANAVLDGTDAVMLSGESAAGRYPVEAVAMLARIAACAESRLAQAPLPGDLVGGDDDSPLGPEELIALSVYTVAKRSAPATILVPTVSGATARRIARFRLAAWITAVSPREKSCQELLFSFGVHPVHEAGYPGDWNAWAREWLSGLNVEGKLVALAEGPSPNESWRNHRLALIELRG